MDSFTNHKKKSSPKNKKKKQITKKGRKKKIITLKTHKNTEIQDINSCNKYKIV